MKGLYPLHSVFKEKRNDFNIHVPLNLCAIILSHRFRVVSFLKQREIEGVYRPHVSLLGFYGEVMCYHLVSW